MLVEVTPSDNTVGYFTLVIDEADYAGDANLTARIRQSIEQVALEQGISVEQAVEAVCWRGVSKELWDGLTPSTGYYALAYAMNADASAAGPLTRERFTTLGENVSAATCTIDCDKYFDGDALYALDPVRYANLAGRVYAPATARPSSDAAHWYIALARGDLSDPVFYPDDATINALLQGGTPDIREMNYVADWGEATLLAVAADEYYQFGAVFRRQITFSREGASPVSELETASVLSAAQTGLLEAPAKVSRTTHDARRPSPGASAPRWKLRRFTGASCPGSSSRLALLFRAVRIVRTALLRWRRARAPHLSHTFLCRSHFHIQPVAGRFAETAAMPRRWHTPLPHYARCGGDPRPHIPADVTCRNAPRCAPPHPVADRDEFSADKFFHS